ncbi:MAG: preprotein translocase subunit SecG [Firmicutes bacterium]|nr:preprotein translocase subunit SecG [Bacillota bacterium]
MDILRIVLIVLEAICSVGLVVTIMLQSGKENGLSAISGRSDSYLNKNGGMDRVLASATKWIALVWALLALSLSFI